MSATCIADLDGQVARQSDRANAALTAKAASPIIWHSPTQRLGRWPTWSLLSCRRPRLLTPRSRSVAGEELAPVDL